MLAAAAEFYRGVLATSTYLFWPHSLFLVYYLWRSQQEITIMVPTFSCNSFSERCVLRASSPLETGEWGSFENGYTALKVSTWLRSKFACRNIFGMLLISNWLLSENATAMKSHIYIYIYGFNTILWIVSM